MRYLLIGLVLVGFGCATECESACIDWIEGCGYVENGHCSGLCDMAAEDGEEEQQTQCYSCLARHPELCQGAGSVTGPGDPCYHTCGG
jgi:hypothetical protein